MTGESLDKAGFGLGESSWLIRDEAGNILTHLELGTVAPHTLVTQHLTIEYRGIVPIKVLGFYLTSVDPSIYGGLQTSIIDTAEIIRWGDDYSSDLTSLNKAGLCLSYTDFESEGDLLFGFKGGQGDSSTAPIPYTGHQDGILDVDQRMKVSLFLSTPSDTDRQIETSTVYSFGFDIVFVEIPERLQDLIVPSEI